MDRLIHILNPSDGHKRLLEEEGRKLRDARRIRHNELCRKYCLMKRATDPRFRMISSMRSRVRSALKRSRKSSPTMEMCGCSRWDLQDHMESKFTEGMNWDNFGEWHVDHVIPCAVFNFDLPEHQELCFHWSNLQPLWADDNFNKSDKFKGIIPTDMIKNCLHCGSAFDAKTIRAVYCKPSCRVLYYRSKVDALSSKESQSKAIRQKIRQLEERLEALSKE